MAFLVSQVGAHTAQVFAGKLVALDLLPNQVGVLRILQAQPCLSQRALSQRMALLPSQLVPLLDGLEARALVERRQDLIDRRRNALYLTAAGEAAMGAVDRLTQDLEDGLFKALSEQERETLGVLLRRVVDSEGLIPAVHPDYHVSQNP